MRTKQDKTHLYQVRIKGTPPSGFKPKYYEGIAIALNPKEAESVTISRLQEDIRAIHEGEPVPITYTVVKTKKIRADFLFDVRKKKEVSGGQ